jgi:cytoskeletal protein CcmA (bactofilin family)
MFGKLKDSLIETPATTFTGPAVATLSSDSLEVSSISSSITVVGKISGKGTVRISGRLEGEIQASTVLIDDGAQVEGDILAEELTIGGRVKGTIHASRVKLIGSAIVEGDIFHRSLCIDENARFEGSSRREETVLDTPRLALSGPESQGDVGTVDHPTVDLARRRRQFSLP